MTKQTRPTEPFAVLENREAAREQRLVVVDGGAAARAYVAAGQLVEVESGGVRAYLVLASPLAERPRLALLVRQHRGAVAGAIGALSPGQTVSMTHPYGPGFPLERTRGCGLWLCVAGTGIASVRPLLHELAATRPSLADVHLYYGVRTQAHVAFADEIATWEARGLTVRICLSEEAPTRARDRAGWVQRAIEAEHPALAGAALVFAGPRDMGMELRALAASLGMPAERFLTNF